MNLIEELKWRGMVQDITPGTEEQLIKEMTSAYVGFDPTADSLHIGSLVPILLLKHLQLCGHKPYALVGGATGMVGDPSGKSEERNLLSEDVLNHNVKGIQSQLEKFLDFDASKPNAAEIVNNYDWFKDFSFLNFIRDIGKHIPVNYMLSKDSVKKRLDSDAGMSFTEFTYQLIQGYDFLHLHQTKNCKIQMGGSDQWGNIVTGAELIRRKCGGEAFAFTCPLVTKADGGKFGKTEKGNIWLDPIKTTPYQFFQFWLNSSDIDAEKWIKMFTLLSKEEVFEVIDKHKKDESKRLLQRRLAEEVTKFVHGIDELKNVIQTTEKLFNGSENLSLEDLENMSGLVKFSCDNIDTDVVSFLHDTTILSSKGEAKKMIKNGGVQINHKKVDNMEMKLDKSMLLHNKYLLVQRGKKNYFLVEFN
jgi:tyrosyl-tRNA synthetase